MIAIVRLLTYLIELAASLPIRFARFFTEWVAFNPRLGPLRYVAIAAAGYVAFALLLVYVLAPLRGLAGHMYLSDKLRYDAERWLATAIYDNRGGFVGTFDPRLDSQRDVNYTDAAIEVGEYTANPDHKSIPVREAPEFYWQCLLHHEDRYLGGPLNPFGIDLLGVLKIPYSSVKRSLALRRPSLGVGGSTLPMQLVRVIYKTPPDARESGLEKLRRKLAEWWLAPVVYRELTAGGDITPLKQWAANHIWLAQRTGGAPLHGVEVTSRIVFGKEAKDLSIAEQFVLASAVNKPIILMPGSETLNEVRLDRWRYITEVRARTCAEKLLTDETQKKAVVFELINLAGGPPDPRMRPRLQAALDSHAPSLAKRALANPVIRANALMQSARFGLREEMKQRYGFGWRAYVRGVTTTFDAADNLAYGQKINAALVGIDAKVRDKIAAGYTLDPAHASEDVRMPDVIAVAANARGDIVRYFESTQTAPYFGASSARDSQTGLYVSERDPRMIASTGKMIAAIAIANEGRDTVNSLYLDTEAPSSGLETCAKGGSGRHGRRAIVAFACSLNNPLINRAALVGQSRVRHIIDRLGFNMPPANADGEGTPPSTAAVLGLVSGSPRRVHQMSGLILATLLHRGGQPVPMPTLIKSYDFTSADSADAPETAKTTIVPKAVIKPYAAALLKALLEAPLCYTVGGAPAGTLKSLAQWCPSRRGDLRLHFAKTGTQVSVDPNATVDAWITGGLQFKSGAAYTYVVLVGTGSASKPWATGLHAAQVAAPVLDVLLQDLAKDARKNGTPDLLPIRATRPIAVAPKDQNAPARTATDALQQVLH